MQKKFVDETQKCPYCDGHLVNLNDKKIDSLGSALLSELEHSKLNLSRIRELAEELNATSYGNDVISLFILGLLNQDYIQFKQKLDKISADAELLKKWIKIQEDSGGLLSLAYKIILSDAQDKVLKEFIKEYAVEFIDECEKLSIYSKARRDLISPYSQEVFLCFSGADGTSKSVYDFLNGSNENQCYRSLKCFYSQNFSVATYDSFDFDKLIKKAILNTPIFLLVCASQDTFNTHVLDEIDTFLLKGQSSKKNFFVYFNGENSQKEKAILAYKKYVQDKYGMTVQVSYSISDIKYKIISLLNAEHNNSEKEKLLNADFGLNELQRLASNGNCEAMFKLAKCYFNGEGVNKSYEKAVEFYKKAADLGHSDSQYNLGVCYFEGTGVVRSYEKAVELFKQATNQGDYLAQSTLGLCYSLGLGVEKSMDKAVELWEKSAANGCEYAQLYLGKHYAQKNEFEKSSRFYLEAAQKGNAEAQYMVGLDYLVGRAVSQSNEKGIEWLLKSAEQGYSLSQYMLGILYKTGQGVNVSYEEAFKWFKKSAEQGNADAQNELGVFYEFGYGVPSSLSKAFEYYFMGANNNSVYAQSNLGRCYYCGRGTTISYEEAFKWLKKSADKGEGTALFYLGKCYELGQGIQQSYEKAYEAYEKASEKGDIKATFAMFAIKNKIKSQ